jgi:hypothetical protein
MNKHIKLYEDFLDRQWINEAETKGESKAVNESVYGEYVKKVGPALTKFLKEKGINWPTSLKGTEQRGYIQIESAPVSGKDLGIMQYGFKSVVLTTRYGTEASIMSDGVPDLIVFGLSYQYEHPNGGTNGTDLILPGTRYNNIFYSKTHDKFYTWETQPNPEMKINESSVNEKYWDLHLHRLKNQSTPNFKVGDTISNDHGFTKLKVVHIAPSGAFVLQNPDTNQFRVYPKGGLEKVTSATSATPAAVETSLDIAIQKANHLKESRSFSANWYKMIFSFWDEIVDDERKGISMDKRVTYRGKGATAFNFNAENHKAFMDFKKKAAEYLEKQGLGFDDTGEQLFVYAPVYA